MAAEITPSKGFIPDSVRNEQEDLQNLVAQMKEQRGRKGPFCIPIGDDATGPIVLLAPLLTTTGERNATFVVIDPETGYWGITFRRRIEIHSGSSTPVRYDDRGAQYHQALKSIADTAALRGETLNGGIATNGNNGLTITLGNGRYTQFGSDNFYIGRVEPAIVDGALEASLSAAQNIHSGEIFNNQRATNTAVRSRLESASK